MPTVPFILGRLGIPIFGNKAIPSWQWHIPNDHFFLFLSQAENDLPLHGQRLAGTEPRPTDRREDSAPHPCSSPSLCLSSFLLSQTIFGDSFFHFFYHFHFLSTAFVPAPFLHSVSFFPCAQMILRYSSYSPEDALIPPFFTSVGTPFQKTFEDTMTKQIYKAWVEFRILFKETWVCMLVCVCVSVCMPVCMSPLHGRHLLNLHYDINMTTLSFLRQSIVFTGVTWMYLALANWLRVGAVKMCVQPQAVRTQMMPHLVFCVQGQTQTEQKPCWTPCWNKETFSKAPDQHVWNMPANWTSHSLLRDLARICFIHFWGFIATV